MKIRISSTEHRRSVERTTEVCVRRDVEIESRADSGRDPFPDPPNPRGIARFPLSRPVTLPELPRPRGATEPHEDSDA